MDAVEEFTRRLEITWLPVYCKDGKRRYDPAGFKPESIKVTSQDAHDFMRALDEPELLRDIGGLRVRGGPQLMLSEHLL